MGFLKGLFKKKEGGTGVGNFFRKVTKGAGSLIKIAGGVVAPGIIGGLGGDPSQDSQNSNQTLGARPIQISLGSQPAQNNDSGNEPVYKQGWFWGMVSGLVALLGLGWAVSSADKPKKKSYRSGKRR